MAGGRRSPGRAPAADPVPAPSVPGAPLEPTGTGAAVPGSAASPYADRLVTIPNALSLVRLLGVPLFLWLVLGPERDGLAILVLVVAGITDYLDGRLARTLGQYSRVGELLDPLADRLYIAATLLALVARDGLPLWWALALVGRDALLALTLPVLKRHGYGPLPVSFLGKAATFNLLYAFPMLLAALPGRDAWWADLVRPFGWAFATWGSVLYWLAGVLYVVQVRQVVRDARRAAEGAVP